MACGTRTREVSYARPRAKRVTLRLVPVMVAWRRFARFVSVVACFIASLLLARRASADPVPLDGAWIAGPMSESITVTSWVDECGPRPKPHVLGGGSCTVSAAGDELVFSGPQPFRTDACFTQEETRRVSHSATPSLRTWKTRCESAPGDPRTASLTTVVRATSDDVIVLTETAHYASTLQSGTCAADVERARTYSRVVKTAASTSASATTTATATSAPTTSATIAAPIAPKTPVCDEVGPPSRLEVRPKRKVIRPGESFDFDARVLDDKGCEVTSGAGSGPTITFRLAPESSSLASEVLVDATGHVKVRADAEPVDAALVAEAGPPLSTSVHVDLEVVSDERYAELLGTGGLDDAGADDRPATVVVSNQGSPPSSIVEPAGDSAARKKLAWLAILGGVGVLLALAVVVAARRRHGRDDFPSEPPPPRRDRPARGAPTEIGVPSGGPLPVGADAPQASTKVGVPDPLLEPDPKAPQIRVCTQCGERYPPDAAFCPVDGSKLVAVRDPLGRAPSAPAPEPTSTGAGRICPVCGRRYARDASFCGRDGVELVPLN